MKKVIFSLNNRLTHLENALSSKITLNRRKYFNVTTKIRLSSADIQTNVYSDMRLIWRMNAVSEAVITLAQPISLSQYLLYIIGYTAFNTVIQ